MRAPFWGLLAFPALPPFWSFPPSFPSLLPFQPLPPSSFEPERFDRVEARGLARRVETEEDADQRGDADGDRHSAGRNDGGPLEHLLDRARGQQAHANAQHPASQ